MICSSKESVTRRFAFLLLLLSASIAVESLTLQAQVGPSAAQPLALSLFGGATGTYTGLYGGHNLGATLGADLDLPPVFYLHPSLEARATYAFDQGQIVGEKNLLAGLRQNFRYRWLHPYADILLGPGRLQYIHPLPDPAGNYLYIHSSSLVLSPGAGIDIRLTPRFALKADLQLQRYSTPVTTAGILYAKPITIGVVYRFDRNHFPRRGSNPGGQP